MPELPAWMPVSCREPIDGPSGAGSGDGAVVVVGGAVVIRRHEAFDRVPA